MVEWKKIGDIAKCYAGATPSTKNASYWEDGIIPWMSSGEVHQGIVTHTATYITQLGYDNSSTKMIPKGSIVIALAGQGKTRGSVAITDIELCTNQSLCGIVLDKSDIINKYVYYFLGTRYNHLRKISSGEGTRGGLNLKMISEYEIPIPAISEQVRIVGILDTFTSSIDNLKQQIVQRRKQYEYYRDQLLDLEGKEGVEMKTLGEIFDTRNGYTPSTSNSAFWDGGVIPWFKMEDIRDNGRILSDSNLHITPFAVKGKGLFKANSIILATSATIGEHALITVEHLCNQRFTNFYPNKDYADKVNMKYFYYYMFVIDEWCKQHLKQGSFASVDMTGLFNLLIPVPSLSEQQRIVDILDKFEASIQNLEAQLAQREKQYEYYRNKLLTFED